MLRPLHRWALLFPLVLAAACSTSDHYRTRIRIPRPAEVRLADYESIQFTNFFLTPETDPDKPRPNLRVVK